MKNIVKTIIAVFPILFAYHTVSAQESAVETPGAMFLEITTDARSAALGGISSSVNGGAFGIFGNAAANIFSEAKFGAGFTLSARSEFSEGSLYTGGVFLNIDDKNGVAIGFRYFDAPSVSLDSWRSIDPRETAVDIAYARKIVGNLSLSLTGRYIDSYMGGSSGLGSANTFGVDIGAYYESGLSAMDGAKWNLGLQASNLGGKLEYGKNSSYSLPGRVKLGGGAYLPFSENHAVTATANVAYRMLPSDFSTFEFGVGVEYNLYRYGFLRAGYHIGDESTGLGSFATVGAGVAVAGLRLDASYWLGAPDQDFKNIVFLSLSFGF